MLDYTPAQCKAVFRSSFCSLKEEHQIILSLMIEKECSIDTASLILGISYNRTYARLLDAMQTLDKVVVDRLDRMHSKQLQLL